MFFGVFRCQLTFVNDKKCVAQCFLSVFFIFIFFRFRTSIYVFFHLRYFYFFYFRTFLSAFFCFRHYFRFRTFICVSNEKRRKKTKENETKRKKTLKTTLGDVFFIVYKRQLTPKDTKRRQLTSPDVV